MKAADLKDKRDELKRELFHLRLKMHTGQLEDKSRVRKVRRDIARIQTRIRDLERQA